MALRQLRTQAGLSLRELGRRALYDFTRLSRAEVSGCGRIGGRRPPVDARNRPASIEQFPGQVRADEPATPVINACAMCPHIRR